MQASVYHIAVTLVGLVQYSKVILCIEISANTDQDFEEIPCETEMSEEWSMPLLRNGLGDDSYFIWADKKIPFVIGDGFGKNETDNIKDAVANYNDIFKGCLEWVEKTDQVSMCFCTKTSFRLCRNFFEKIYPSTIRNYMPKR